MLLNGNLNIKVGDTIDIQYLERFNTNPNTLLNGLYLVTKTAHHVSSKNFYTKVEVQKNAYYKGGILSNVVL